MLYLGSRFKTCGQVEGRQAGGRRVGDDGIARVASVSAPIMVQGACRLLGGSSSWTAGSCVVGRRDRQEGHSVLSFGYPVPNKVLQNFIVGGQTIHRPYHNFRFCGTRSILSRIALTSLSPPGRVPLDKFGGSLLLEDAPNNVKRMGRAGILQRQRPNLRGEKDEELKNMKINIRG